MKKLSLIMVLALVLTAFTAMLVMNVSAETRPDADAPTEIIDYHERRNEATGTYTLVSFHCDECAVAGAKTHGGAAELTPAIGRFSAEGGDGYATSWSAVGANASDCTDTQGNKVSVFYIIKDFTLDGSAQRITFDLGGSKRALVIDGALGKLRTTGTNAGKNFSITSNERAIHYAGNKERSHDAATLTFKNITISSTGGTVMQSNYGLTVIFGEGCVASGGTSYSFVVGDTTKMVAEAGSKFDNSGKPIFLPNGAGATVEIKGGTFNAKYLVDTNQPGAIINFNGTGSYTISEALVLADKDNTTVNLISGNTTVTNFGIQLSGANSCTINGTNGTLQAKRVVQSLDGASSGASLTINGGTLIGTDYYAVTFKDPGTLTVNGGTIKSAYSGTATTYGVIMLEQAGSTVNITGGTIDTDSGKVRSGIWDHTGGNTINVKGGKIVGGTYGIYPNGASSTINITGGEISGTYGIAIQKSNTTLNVSGSNTKISGTTTAIVNNVGDNVKITIDGGTFTSGSNTIDIYTADATKDVIQNTVVNIRGGKFVSTGGHVIYSNANDGTEGGSTNVLPNTKINIYGGEFIAEASDKVAICSGNSTTNNGKVVSVYGGIFKSYNKDVAIDDTSIDGVNSGSVGSIKSWGVVYSQADNVNIYGGEFWLYKDAGKTLATEGACVVAHAGGVGYTRISGGAYNGGVYLTFQAPHQKKASVVLAGTAGNFYKMPTAGGSVDLNITVQQGASVRTVEGSAGIRFQGVITQTAIDFVTSYYGSDVIRGVAITTAENLAAAGGDFNVDALYAAGGLYASTNSKLGWIANKDGTYTARLALTGLTDYAQKYVAVAFVAYDADKSGTLTTGDKAIYSSTTSGERSIGEVAAVALADVKDTAGRYNGVYYGTEVTVDSVVKYSRYTTKQLEILNTFA